MRQHWLLFLLLLGVTNAISNEWYRSDDDFGSGSINSNGDPATGYDYYTGNYRGAPPSTTYRDLGGYVPETSINYRGSTTTPILPESIVADEFTSWWKKSRISSDIDNARYEPDHNNDENLPQSSSYSHDSSDIDNACYEPDHNNDENLPQSSSYSHDYGIEPVSTYVLVGHYILKEEGVETHYNYWGERSYHVVTKTVEKTRELKNFTLRGQNGKMIIQLSEEDLRGCEFFQIKWGENAMKQKGRFRKNSEFRHDRTKIYPRKRRYRGKNLNARRRRVRLTGIEIFTKSKQFSPIYRIV